jgi:hypothetical protein
MINELRMFGGKLFFRVRITFTRIFVSIIDIILTILLCPTWITNTCLGLCFSFLLTHLLYG